MGSTTLLLLPLLVLLVLIVALRRLPTSVPSDRFLLGVRLVVATIVLAPAAVRCGPSHSDLRPYANDVVRWRDLAEKVPAAGGVILSSSFEGPDVEAVIAGEEEFRRVEADVEAKRRRLNPQKDFLKWMRLPKPMNASEVKQQATVALSQYDRKAAGMNAAGALALLIAIGAIVGGLTLSRRSLSGAATPKEAGEANQRISKLAIRGAGIGAVAAVLWTVTGTEWIPDFGLIVPLLSLGACWPLVQLGRRLRRADDALASDPEVLAEQRVRQHAASLQTRNARLSADLDAAAVVVGERTTYLASLQATAPGAPAVATAEGAVAAAQAHLEELKLKQAAPAADFAGELRDLQTAISEKRKHSAVLAAGGAPPEVIESAHATVEDLRRRFRDLADRAGAGT